MWSLVEANEVSCLTTSEMNQYSRYKILVNSYRKIEVVLTDPIASWVPHLYTLLDAIHGMDLTGL